MVNRYKEDAVLAYVDRALVQEREVDVDSLQRAPCNVCTGVMKHGCFACEHAHDALGDVVVHEATQVANVVGLVEVHVHEVASTVPTMLVCVTNESKELCISRHNRVATNAWGALA